MENVDRGGIKADLVPRQKMQKKETTKKTSPISIIDMKITHRCLLVKQFVHGAAVKGFFREGKNVSQSEHGQV